MVLKEELIGPLSKYLGGKLREITLTSGVKCWAFRSCQYVQLTVNNVVDHLWFRDLKLPYKAPNPLTFDYCPEIDVSQELGEDDASYYQTLIGVL